MLFHAVHNLVMYVLGCASSRHSFFSIDLYRGHGKQINNNSSHGLQQQLFYDRCGQQSRTGYVLANPTPSCNVAQATTLPKVQSELKGETAQHTVTNQLHRIMIGDRFVQPMSELPIWGKHHLELIKTSTFTNPLVTRDAFDGCLETTATLNWKWGWLILPGMICSS